MLARCTRTFLDIETGDMREAGETFEVTPERLSAINSTKYGQLAEEVIKDALEEPTEARRHKRSGRKAKE